MNNYLKYKLQINIILILLTISSTLGISLAMVKPQLADDKGNTDLTSDENTYKDADTEEIDNLEKEINSIAFDPIKFQYSI